MQSMESMMNAMPGMMFGMGLVWLLTVVALTLGIAALIKYLRSGKGERRSGQLAFSAQAALVPTDAARR